MACRIEYRPGTLRTRHPTENAPTCDAQRPTAHDRRPGGRRRSSAWPRGPRGLLFLKAPTSPVGCWTAGAGRGSSATPAAAEPPCATRRTRWPPDDHAHHATARRACQPPGPQGRVRISAPIPLSSTRALAARLRSRSPRTRSGGTTSARSRSPGVLGSAAGGPCHDLRGNGTGQGAGAPPPLGATLPERHPAGVAHALGMWP